MITTLLASALFHQETSFPYLIGVPNLLSVPVVELFNATTFTSLRSITSKLVEKDETGIIFILDNFGHLRNSAKDFDGICYVCRAFGNK